jgi:hypothetical protein
MGQGLSLGQLYHVCNKLKNSGTPWWGLLITTVTLFQIPKPIEVVNDLWQFCQNAMAVRL